MRTILFILLSLNIAAQPVNAILGDSSWFAAQGRWPSSEDPEQLRLETHLQFVHQKLLATTEAKDSMRLFLLNTLKKYIDQGNFPRYFNHPDSRRPCFIDDAGTLCAVGHLIAESAGRAEAERINREFRFHYLLDMQDSALVAWQKTSGLSLRELAMIQPAYGWERQAAYYLYRSPRTHKYGLKRTQDDKTVIRARYDILRVDPSLPFVYGKDGDDWHIFLGNGDRINHKDYSYVHFVRTRTNFRLIAATKEEISGFNPDGEEAWSLEMDIDSAIVQRQSQIKIYANDKQGAINARGDLIIPPVYHAIEPIYSLDQQLIAWKVQEIPKGGHELKLGIIDSAGVRIEESKYNRIEYRRGLYQLETSRETSLINYRGESVVGWGLKSVSDGLCRYCLIIETEKGFGHYNGAALKWDYPSNLEELKVENRRYYRVKKNGRYGYMDVIGQLIIAPIYEDVQILNERIFLKKDSKWGMKDYNGESTVIPLEYDTLGLLVEDNNNYKKAFLIYGRRGTDLQFFNSIGQELSHQYSWEDFKSLGPSVLLLKKGDRKVVAQFFNGSLIYKTHLQLDYARPLVGWHRAYGKNGKEGLWTLWPGRLMEERDFKPAVFDTILIAHPRTENYYLVSQDDKWGIYSVKGDSLVIPCESEDYYPKDRSKHSGWIYFRKEGIWWGYFYTVPSLKYVMPATQEKVEAWWKEEEGEG